MNIIKSLWPVPSETSILIPNHREGGDEDPLDLKVKSLSYFFKRFKIDKYPTFVPANSDENGLDTNDTKRDANDRLDSAYNRGGFEKVILSNEHRILVDWAKNRFRSLLILSELQPGIKKGELSEFLGKESHGFCFLSLNADAPDEEYIDIIVNKSSIYQEHGVDVDKRTTILKEIIRNQRDSKPSYKRTFNKDDRALIILKYVEKLSETVQIERIYKASLLSKLETDFKSGTKALKSHSEVTLNNIDEVEESTANNKGIRAPRSPGRRYSNDPNTRPTLSVSPTKVSALQTVRLAPSSPVSSSIKIFQDLNQSSTSLSSLTSNTSISRPPSALRSRSTSPVKSLKKKKSMTLLKMDNSLQQHTRSNSFNSDSASITDGISKDEIDALKKQSENAVLTRLERERRLLKS